MWLALRDDGIFATTQARVAIVAAIPATTCSVRC
jgi:hypothetical protein